MKVPVTQEEKRLSYYKYYERDLAPISEEGLKRMEAGPEDPSRLLPFDRRNDFIKGQDQEFCQNGFGIFEDGTGTVCARMFMPRVTPEMLDWWFPWHSVGSDLRYKIWDPEDHYFVYAHPAEKVLDPSVPVRQKTWGVTHYLMENVGRDPQFVQIRFARPKDAGIDEALIGTEFCAGLVCGFGRGRGALMIHKWYPEKDGVIFQSRFWNGWGIKEDGTPGRTLPEGITFPVEICKAIFAHSLKEYTNLSSFLPELYEEEKDNW